DLTHQFVVIDPIEKFLQIEIHAQRDQHSRRISRPFALSSAVVRWRSRSPDDTLPNPQSESTRTAMTAPMATELTIVVPTPEHALSPTIDRARTYAQNAKASATRRGYAGDWRRFEEWCTT